jgi:UDP-N-acetylglucosamine--N-acetylmuramyl-(pentapeptide) pyrophosphoryl-undecaprenol N-acetylglucosamine transferase
MTMDNSNKKILIMAGGTGGHVFPALSIAEYLKSRGVQVEWLGTRKGLEASVISNTDIPLHYISIAGLRGTSLFKKLLSPFVILLAVIQAMRKVMLIKPGCVLGMGGFVTGPGGLAAWLLRKKLLIHEQNAIAGLTNQLLFPLASTVMEAFPGAFERKREITGNRLLKSFIKPGNTVVVGNPVRKEIADLGMSRSDEAGATERALRILVIGGSLGAVAINKTIPAMLALMGEEGRPEVIHQCGNRNLEETRKFYLQHQIQTNGSIQVVPFIEDMAESYNWADIIVARAGAMTVAEIATVGLASILIPYPYAVDDHQTENAGYLERAEAADVIQQDVLDAEKLKQLIEKYSENRSLLQQVSRNARQAGSPDATEKAAMLCMEACYA